MTFPSQIELFESPFSSSVEAALETLSKGGIVERGAVFTRREVVEFILDLVGYKIDKPLHQSRLLEPSFGKGDFLIPIIERLLKAVKKQKVPRDNMLEVLMPAIRGVELHRETYKTTRKRIALLLAGSNFTEEEIEELLNAWFFQGDFLLKPINQSFSYIVGNPPYVRQELIPDVLIAEYRNRYHTIYDRADIYIPFIEKSLSLLENEGTLGFICSDRWMKNRYGSKLRKLVAENFHLKFYVDMVDTPAFHSEVIAYPAITVIKKEKSGTTKVARRPKIESSVLSSLSCALTSDGSNEQVKELSGIVRGSEPWILESSDRLAVLRRLESDFPSLEEANCKVGIGVATGADKVFIAPFEELDIENDRKLPLVMTRDISNGEINWRGFAVVNPFNNDGTLVNLSRYPRLAAYLDRHSEAIKGRHVSKKNPKDWYRTIDRIYPELTKKAKLLIPDIKGNPHIVYDSGKFYPHHNLYYITSDDWNLKALQTVLRSGIARLFVSVYSTKMHGGFLRFQAQYLRRIRIPRWQDVKPKLRDALMKAADSENSFNNNFLVAELYSLTQEEKKVIDECGE
jgi:hypothetical protein